MSLHTLAFTILPILAQEPTAEKSYTLPWFLIILSMGLGLYVALKPAKREVTVKKAED